MLRITTQRSAAQVKRYYEHSDYYEDGPNALKGYWIGKGAEALGLTGYVDKNKFDRIAENLHPFEERSLTPRTRADRRVGWDLTFSVSKSVSLWWALTGDDRILDIIQEAGNETLREIEKDVLTRVHVGDQMHTEKTGNMIGAVWLHSTSRPVDGRPPMPQLHMHAWIANATEHEGKFKAVDLSGVYKDAPYYEARFHSRLASKLRDRYGFGIERQGKKWFEIGGIAKELLVRFSERTTQIESVARMLGIVDPDAKGELGAKTRAKKSYSIGPRELPQVWRSMLTDDEFRSIFDGVQQANQKTTKVESASEAVEHVVEHRFERDATVRERELLTDAVWRGIEHYPIAAIENAVLNREFIRDGKDEQAWVTTREVLREEAGLLAFAREGRGSCAMLANETAVQRTWLSDEQREAALKLWRSKDRVIIFTGKAGTGKSTLAKEVVEGIEKHGGHVVMIAPTTKAVAVLERDEFEANTLAQLLVNKDLQAEAAGQTIWVDEAGLVSSIDMAKLFALAKQIDARIILSGDAKQHSPVSRGKPLELLETEAGIKPITITEIRRQEDPAYRAAVAQLSVGKIAEGVESLHQMGAIHELGNETRDKQIANSYADAMESGIDTLIVSPSNAEKDRVSAAVRAELRKRGLIDGEEVELSILSPYKWTEAEKKDARMYKVGDVVEFRSKGKGGFIAGDRATVTRVSTAGVQVTRKGVEIDLPLDSNKAYSVFRPQQQRFAKGDMIKITQNRRQKAGQQRLNNGTRNKIAGFSANGDILLQNGSTIAKDWGHFEHGLTSTSYSSQGDTSKKVIVAQSSLSFGASSAEQLYVSVSRGKLKDGIEIYTDSYEGLKRSVQRDRSVPSATAIANRAFRSTQQQDRSPVHRRISQLRHIFDRTADTVRRQIEWARQLTHLSPPKQVAAR